jgi:hypothetical protein
LDTTLSAINKKHEESDEDDLKDLVNMKKFKKEIEDDTSISSK